MTFLDYNYKAYPWYQKDKTYFRGYLIVNDQMYVGIDCIDYLQQRLEKEDVSLVIGSLNGFFSFIFNIGENTIFAVDKNRGFPLYYSIIDYELYLTSNPDLLIKKFPESTLSQVSIGDICSTDSFVLGPYTLIDNLYAVQAGELCEYKNSSIEVKRSFYWRSTHLLDYEDNLDLLKKSFKDAYALAGKHLVKELNGRTALIPLSGGYDSRMIVSMLKENNYENVICFTYGKEGNDDSKLSKIVAERAGYKWYFIPYTPKLWEELRTDSEFNIFLDYACGYISTPHIQDFPAIKYLKTNHLIPDNCVVVPGHTGDMVAGSHIGEIYTREGMKYTDFLNSLYNFFIFHDLPETTKSRIRELYSPAYTKDANYDSQTYLTWEERLDISERQAKYIINSVRTYEFFGLEWLLPLWDNSIVEFWAHIPIKWRYKRRLYILVESGDIPTTHEKSLISIIEEFLRRIKFVNSVARRISRVRRWNDSSMYLEHFIEKKTYYKYCITEHPLFRLETIITKEIIKKYKRKYN